MDRIFPYEDAPSFDLSTDALVAGFGGGESTMMSACEMYLGGSGGARLQREGLSLQRTLHASAAWPPAGRLGA